MSLKIASLVWNDPEITNTTDRLVMLALANHSDDEGLSWPSVDRLERMTQLCQRSIYNSISRLKSTGKLSVESGGGRHKVNRYRITLHQMQGINPELGAGFNGETLHLVQETLHAVQRNPAPDAPQPSVKHKEPSVLSGVYRNGEQKAITNARVIIHFLNEQAGRSYRETPGTFKLIRARLAEVNDDVEGVKAMIVRQVKRWRGSDMEEYLRPETLFGKTKFSGYYDNRNLPLPGQNQPRSNNPNPQNVLNLKTLQ